MPALQSPFASYVIVYMGLLMLCWGLGGGNDTGDCFGSRKKRLNGKKWIWRDNLTYVGLALYIGYAYEPAWAKEAWGHYWAWDPKETWAAATWFSFILHIYISDWVNR